MDINLYSAKLQAKVISSSEKAKEAYEKNPELNAYWQFIDLVDSSNTRIQCGPREGYLRNEMFIALVEEAIAPCGDIFLIKEIGDEVFLSSPSVSHLLESSILILHAARALEEVVPHGADYPFAVRTAIGFGPAKRIARPYNDYIGESIDSLSRLMNIKNGTGFAIHEMAYDINKSYIDEYSPIINISGIKMLPETCSKGLSTKQYYREISINYDKLREYKNNFEPWKKQHMQNK